jgi:hypothetical protein
MNNEKSRDIVKQTSLFYAQEIGSAGQSEERDCGLKDKWGFWKVTSIWTVVEPQR